MTDDWTALPEPAAAPDQWRQLRFAAMGLLARREHSRQELVQKLSRRVEDAELVVNVVAQLAQEGLQSDERFADAYCRMRYQKGYGPLRVRMELREKGIAAEQVNCSLERDELDWFARAQEVWQRRFGRQAEDIKQKSAQYRFLQQRGFTGDQISAALAIAGGAEE